MASDVPGTSLRAYRINNTRDRHWDRLMAIYEGVFERGEKEPPECLAAHLSAEGHEKPGGHIVLAAIEAVGDCLGGIIFSYLGAVNSGYVSYLMVAPEAQGRGIGRGLVHAARHALDVQARRWGRRGADGVFTELQKELVAEPRTYARFRFWERLGVRPLDFEWEYPELANGRTPVPMYLAFGSFTGERPWTPGALVSVVDSIFTATYAHLPGADAVRARIVARLAARTPHLPVAYREVGNAPVPGAQP